ncbi:hypothetical protein Gorai_017884 [Gossypium raimondii]|uniref:Uncharacterized protein n=1 Tax=Gossypium raimondii TaxID=29730 RepID=A0A7J8PIL3_GOSRA|nr:hypothetical protein [Gossypium raimondii]
MRRLVRKSWKWSRNTMSYASQSMISGTT